jgi:hypothetical protein
MPLTDAGIAPADRYVDKKSGATTERPGLQVLLGYARGGDVIVVHTSTGSVGPFASRGRLSHRPRGDRYKRSKYCERAFMA